MNKNDRKKIEDLKSQLEDLRGKVEDIGSELQTLADDEQDKYNNLPEGLQQTERGQNMEQDAQTLSEAVDACESGNVQDAIDALENLS